MLDLLNPEEICDIRDDVKSILEDCDFDREIIYRRLTDRAFNTGTGATTRTVSDTPIKAFMGNHSAGDVANSGGILQLGDVIFMFDPNVLDGFPMGDDQIICEESDNGHVKLISASATVLGYNTTWMTDGVQGGDILAVADTTIPIKSISSETGMILKSNWLLSGEPAVRFKIYRVYEIVNRIVDPLMACVRLSARRAGA